jgi:hypothetical protein
MRYVYSLARLVPDIAKGERINLAVFVGSEGEWVTCVTSDLDRVRDFAGADVLEMALGAVSHFGELLEAQEAGAGEAYLTDQAESPYSFVQLSAPAPLAVASLQEAITLVTGELL